MPIKLTFTLQKSSSFKCAEPNSVFKVALVDAYNIFCLTGAVSGDHVIKSHSCPRELVESNLPIDKHSQKIKFQDQFKKKNEAKKKHTCTI